MEIIQKFIPESNKKTRPGIKMTPKYITIHETDNPGAGANANAHAKLQERGNDRQASWHLQIDDSCAIQSVPFNEIAYAAGDGSGPGNMSSIHIEMCVNSDGDYKKTVTNTADVTKQLMGKHNIPMDRVVQHNKWSNKNCPRHLRAGDWGVNWSDFLGMVKGKPAFTDKVIIPNTVYWQVRALVNEFKGKEYHAYPWDFNKGTTLVSDDNTPCWFVVETNFENAGKLKMELTARGYDKTRWETI